MRPLPPHGAPDHLPGRTPGVQLRPGERSPPKEPTAPRTPEQTDPTAIGTPRMRALRQYPAAWARTPCILPAPGAGRTPARGKYQLDGVKALGTCCRTPALRAMNQFSRVKSCWILGSDLRWSRGVQASVHPRGKLPVGESAMRGRVSGRTSDQQGAVCPDTAFTGGRGHEMQRTSRPLTAGRSDIVAITQLSDQQGNHPLRRIGDLDRVQQVNSPRHELIVIEQRDDPVDRLPGWLRTFRHALGIELVLA